MSSSACGHGDVAGDLGGLGVHIQKLHAALGQGVQQIDHIKIVDQSVGYLDERLGQRLDAGAAGAEEAAVHLVPNDDTERGNGGN